MKTSVYTSLFNYSPDKFDLLGAFKNWSKYCDEIVIATFEDQREEIEEEAAYVLERDCIGDNCLFKLWNKIKVVSCSDTSLDDPLFDGKLKNAALQACSNELVIQQDMDERLGGLVSEWERLGETLLWSNAPVAFMTPVIDLYKDYNHHKSVNKKWYFHRKTGSYRGPVNFAKKEGGLIDVTKSDSCELVDENGDLVRYYSSDEFCDNFDIREVHCIHLGYLDLNKRIENNKFWSPIWSSRNGSPIEVADTLEKLEEENEAKIHHLPEKWWEN